MRKNSFPLLAISTNMYRYGVLLLAFCLTALAACGGGNNQNHPVSQVGNLTVLITGLPSDVSPAISVAGPNSYISYPSTTTALQGLPPGTYTITAGNVASNTSSMVPTPLSQQIQVTAGHTVTATVAYVAVAPLGLALHEVAAGLEMPVFLTAAPGDINRQFIVERPGRIRIIENNILLPMPFLDISNLTSMEGERGLLSMAFHPKYADNGYFFIFYTNLAGNIIIERRQVSPANRNLADPQSALQFMNIPHPDYTNNYGGLVSFGPDGYLYISVGDGGGVGDPNGNARLTLNLLGKLLRINVDLSSPTLPYRSPPDNPFNRAQSIVNGNRPEIWSYGLRNPWRYAFDTVTGLIYIADVGQDRREEINVAPIAESAISYRWSNWEGSLCYTVSLCINPDQGWLAVEYDHENAVTGGCAVIGGYVYRGAAMPDLAGHYLYSDYCRGWLRSFTYSNGVASSIKYWGLTNVGNILSFGQDAQNELYILSATGTVYRIVRK